MHAQRIATGLLSSSKWPDCQPWCWPCPQPSTFSSPSHLRSNRPPGISAPKGLSVYPLPCVPGVALLGAPASKTGEEKSGIWQDFILVLWSSILKFMIEVRDISPLGIVLQIFSQFVLFFDFSFEIFCLDLLLFRRRPWHPTPVLLPGKSHGWRSLVGCSLWSRSESDTTE